MRANMDRAEIVCRQRPRLSVWVLVAALTAGVWAPVVTAAEPAADEKVDMKVQWGETYETLSFRFGGEDISYPQAIMVEDFMPGDEPYSFETTLKWPIVICEARWTVSTADWPAEQRDKILDFVLMRMCDADSFAYLYPKKIIASKLLEGPDLSAPADGEDRPRSFAEALRGKTIRYTMTAKGGFGANDSVIQSKMRIGVSADGKTAFYHDTAESISDNHLGRDFFFAVHDAGDHLRFEVRGHYVSKPRVGFRKKAMNRTAETVRYVIKIKAARLGAPPTSEEIEMHGTMVADDADFAAVTKAATTQRGPLPQQPSSDGWKWPAGGGAMGAALLAVFVVRRRRRRRKP
ncbi:hypothetical protein LCGC14_0016420 [marine sediment metagenome]|uniref:Uncharacterized protein n=1 Tax=marine sediment metagenome TaxID=412755 RepID=A0A0F9W1H5_9ZZZZ|nr:hypothetical protein [Phycisphaerae bacterium]HDZ42851.1 hypothetical protein [Phycisphaerae bacterium]